MVGSELQFTTSSCRDNSCNRFAGGLHIIDIVDIVDTVDTVDNVKSVNSVDNVSSVNSVHSVHFGATCGAKCGVKADFAKTSAAKSPAWNSPSTSQLQELSRQDDVVICSSDPTIH